MNLAQLALGINTAYILYCFALGIWAGVIALRNGHLGGQFWGAMWMCTILAVVGLVVWLIRTLTHEELRSVYVLYELYFIIALPGTFALMRGRDDRVAAAIFAGIAIFTALSAISAADPSRGVIAPHSASTPLGLWFWMVL
jgi:hypothetical protein